MGGRRDTPDPQLARWAQDRLAAVLSPQPSGLDDRPRRGLESEEPENELQNGGLPNGVLENGALENGGLEGRAAAAAERLGVAAAEPAEVAGMPPRRFGRLHLGVVCALLLAGLLGTGWVLLRARPVAVASPTVATISAPPPAANPTSVSTPTAAAPSQAARVVVHVLGAVRRPGLVKLPDRARVQDAIDAAGGLSSSAAPGQLNLAQVLGDGQQVFIGSRQHPAGEVRDGTTPTSTGSSGSSSGGSSGSSSSGSSGGSMTGGSAGTSSQGAIDLNRATQAQLEELPGVGPVTADKIVRWRSEHSRFSRVEELQEVDGIGPKTYAQIAPHVRV